MSNLQGPNVDTETEDLRCVRRRLRHSTAGSTDDNVWFSDSDSDDPSWHSPCGSTTGESHDECGFSGDSVLGLKGNRGGGGGGGCSSSVSDEVDVDLESGVLELKGLEAKIERDCRICQLSLDIESGGGNDDSSAPGFAIELGCSCKNDLAFAHKQCAETWFRIKGNTICEICGTIATTVAGQQANDASNATNPAIAAALAATTVPMIPLDNRRTCNSRRILNFLLGCIVLAFVISWLFHYHILQHNP
ncbi:Zinc finger, RING-CH-type [Dillenia turbinata]|uniref:Zinc finger, RING-CH-type n=1 Tax=Dillenia turbinata TaxID=194707 RepID=A0AAN8VQ20_9MAGN